jgi:2-polyprenyl-3-methyl-5-hydroxy-6-metoxy-1,4-benzoquinol methylase
MENLADFGTYHYSTPRSSARMRAKIKLVFIQSFRNLPFSKNQKIKVLDVGCGLGFISCISAEFYPNAHVTGFDTFEDDSLRNSSLEKARMNAKILGLSDRVRFRKGDVFGSNYARGKYDLIISNLVFHNFGEKRFDAYERLASWARPNSYVLLGDLMFNPGLDVKRLSKHFRKVKVVPAKGVALMYKMLVLSEPK